MTDLTRRAPRSRLAAGVDVGSDALCLALVETDEQGDREVRAIEREPFASEALERGVVRDPETVERAVRAALARAEARVDRRAQTIVVAASADDLRAHRHVARVTRSGGSPVSDAELRRAGERARKEAAREAVRVVGDEAGLRRIALVALHAVPAGVSLDGRPLVAVGRQRGDLLEVELVVPVLPLAQSTGLEAAVSALGRDTRFVAAPLALAALVAESGIEEALVVDVGAQLTGVSVVRGAAPLGARAFSVGTAALGRRSSEGAFGRDDVSTWARCVLVAAREIAGAAPLPTRALVGGAGATLTVLHGAIASALGALQPALGGRADPLRADVLRRLSAPGIALEPTDLVAVAAACA